MLHFNIDMGVLAGFNQQCSCIIAICYNGTSIFIIAYLN